MKLSVYKNVHIIEPGDFEPSDYWYPRVLNSNIHPLVAYFLSLENSQIIERYLRLHPQVNPFKLKEILNYKPKYFFWAGSDLMHVSDSGERKLLTLIETNSCPSGQKSMPLLNLNIEQGGYLKFVESTFLPLVKNHNEEGGLAVIYDKNPMENIGYASAIADCFHEPVYLVYFPNQDPNPSVRFIDTKLFIQVSDSQFIPIRACFRYVTQEPWNRIPLQSKTLILNPIQACLAGGRNKEQAYYAYESFNNEYASFGLMIHTPKTYPNVKINELENFYQKFNGQFVIKLPESNAGQGVFTITNEKEYAQAMSQLKKSNSPSFLVQELVFSKFNPSLGKHLYHLGTLPDLKNRIFAFDIRMMIHSTNQGLRPLAGYSRISRFPLNLTPPNNITSWDLYGTNLSIKSDQGWEYDDARLMIFDNRNFGRLGIGLDELIECFINTCMALFAIDKRAIQLYSDVRQVEQ